MSLPSLVTGGGDEDDAGACDEEADVRERDLVLIPEAKAIRLYEQHHRLRELGEQPRGSGRRGHDGEEKRSWTKVMAVARATVMSKRRGSE